MRHFICFIAVFTCIALLPGRPAIGAEFDAQAAQDILTDITDDDAVAGAVLYITTPEGPAAVISGYANREENVPVHERHGFYIASISKMMTAVVVYKLAERGDIELDAPLSDYIDETFDGELANFYDVTIEQVLGHKDGMADYLTLGYYDHAAGGIEFDASSPIEAAALAKGKPALFPPGSKYAYGSTGYVLLGLMIETVTGQRIQDVYNELIFEPLGMEYTRFGTHPIPHWLARGYVDADGDCTIGGDNAPECIEDVTGIDWGNKLADGGIISTAHDLDIFLRALLDDKTLLSTASYNHMMTATELLADEEYAGRGLTITHKPYGTSIGHLGRYPGYRSAALYLPERDMTLVFWANGMFDMEKKFMHRIVEFLGKAEPEQD